MAGTERNKRTGEEGLLRGPSPRHNGWTKRSIDKKRTTAKNWSFKRAAVHAAITKIKKNKTNGT